MLSHVQNLLGASFPQPGVLVTRDERLDAHKVGIWSTGVSRADGDYSRILAIFGYETYYHFLEDVFASSGHPCLRCGIFADADPLDRLCSAKMVDRIGLPQRPPN